MEVSLAPHELIEALLQIEKGLGRVRERLWGPRTVDLDLLLYDDQMIQTEQLTCPHPRMSFRRFVLEPASEVAPDMIHPPSGCTVSELHDRLDSRPNLLLWVGSMSESIRQALDKRLTPLGARSKVVGFEDMNADTMRDTPDCFFVCRVENTEELNSLSQQTKLIVISGR